mgnify:FL=1
MEIAPNVTRAKYDSGNDRFTGKGGETGKAEKPMNRGIRESEMLNLVKVLRNRAKGLTEFRNAYNFLKGKEGRIGKERTGEE